MFPVVVGVVSWIGREVFIGVVKSNGQTTKV